MRRAKGFARPSAIKNRPGAVEVLDDNYSSPPGSREQYRRRANQSGVEAMAHNVSTPRRLLGTCSIVCVGVGGVRWRFRTHVAGAKALASRFGAIGSARASKTD